MSEGISIYPEANKGKTPPLEIPKKYDHSGSEFSSPLQRQTLNRIKENNKPLALGDLQQIISSEILDIHNQEKDFLQHDATSEQLRYIGQYKKAKEYFSQHPDLDKYIGGDAAFDRKKIEEQYQEFNPFAKRTAELKSLQKIINKLNQNILPEDPQAKKNLLSYINFQKLHLDTLSRDIYEDAHPYITELNDHIDIFEKLSFVVVDQFAAKEINRKRDKQDQQKAFDLHPYFVHQEFLSQYQPPEKQKILTKLKEKITDGEKLTMDDIALLLTAESQDFADEFAELKQEVTLVNEYFKTNPKQNRVAVYLLDDSTPTLKPPGAKDGSQKIISTYFYNKKALPHINKTIAGLEKETNEGRPPVIEEALKTARNFTQLKDQKEFSDEELNGLEYLGHYFSDLVEQSPEDLQNALFDLHLAVYKIYERATIPMHERPITTDLPGFIDALQQMRANGTNPF